LQAEGFVRVPYNRDHGPAGVQDDPARWQKRFWRRSGHEAGDANLHVRLVGSPNERVALLFRDWLRAHPAAVPAYGAFKLALAGAVDVLDSYAEIKDPVVDLVLTAAEPWQQRPAGRHGPWPIDMRSERGRPVWSCRTVLERRLDVGTDGSGPHGRPR
jgi:hypothetical protein